MEERRSPRALVLAPWLKLGGLETALLAMLEIFPVPFDLCICKRGGAFEPLLDKKIEVITFKEAQKRSYDAVLQMAHWKDPSSWIKQIVAKIKVQWIHTDFCAWKANVPLKDGKKCEDIDLFVCVSKKVAESFQKTHPSMAPEKIITVYNVFNSQKIRKLSLEEPEDLKEIQRSSLLKVVSVTRLSREKALCRSVAVHAALEKAGIHVKWYVIGEGPQRKKLEQCIQEHGLQDKHKLLGMRYNPYPYMRVASVVTMQSRFEGFGNVLTEAKILGRPILTTRFAGACEQIENEKTGLIVENKKSTIISGMKRILQDQQFREKLSKNLEGFSYNNEPTKKFLEKLF